MNTSQKVALDVTSQGHTPCLGPELLPVIVGVVGHRELDCSAEVKESVRATVCKLLTALQNEFGGALKVMTALADGADQLVADVAGALKIDIVAVLPMPLVIYRTRVHNVNKLEQHWKNAVLRIELPKAADTGEPWTPGYDERLYEQLGAFITRRSHLLMALWEGPHLSGPRDRVPKPGGTADVIQMRFDVHRANQVCRRSRLFERSTSPLDVAHVQPVVHILAPRARSGNYPVRPFSERNRPGTCFLLKSWPDWKPVKITSVENIMKLLCDNKIFELRKMKNFNDDIIKINNTEITRIRDQYEDIEIDGAATTEKQEAEWLRRVQAGVDAVAGRYQGWILGQKSRPGALLLFTASVPIAVALFEWFAHLPHGIFGLAAYILLSFGIFFFYTQKVAKEKWQDRFQDYRAIAEAIRVQMFWALSALPSAASDNYLRKQTGQLGWIAFALRGPALWGTSLALTLKSPDRDVVISAWMKKQADYFIGKDRKSGKAAYNHHAAKLLHRLAIVSLMTGWIVAILLFLSEFSGCHHPHGEAHSILIDLNCEPASGCFNALMQYIFRFELIFKTVAAVLPAIAAALTVWSNLKAYEAHAHNYKQMGGVFARALDVVADVGVQDHDAFKDLVRDLGREALAENAEWLLDHRDRPVEVGG